MACFARPDAPNPPIRSDDWEPGETVTLRPRLTWAMEAEAQSKSMRVPEGVDLSRMGPAEIAATLQQNMDATAAVQYKMATMIVDWTLTFEGGDAAPCTPQMIAELPKSYADWITEEIEKRGGARTSAEETGPLAMTSPLRSASSSETASPIESAPLPNERSTKRAS